MSEPERFIPSVLVFVPAGSGAALGARIMVLLRIISGRKPL